MAEEIKKKKVVSAADAKTVTKAADETKKAAKKVEEAAEATGTVTGKKKTEEAKPVGNAKGLRIGAVCLWVAAIAFELVAVFTLFGKINITFMNTMTFLIILIVLDLICLVIGSQLWKKANHIDPASKKNKTKFWLWNNMGLIVAIFAFVPLIILLLTNKNLDKKTQTVAVIAACAALLIGGAASIDYNPVSAEEKQVAEANISGEVCWTRYGKVYHIYVDDETWCQHLNNSDSVITGSVEEAIAAGKTRLCKTCAHNHGLEGIEDLPLGGSGPD
ncbi:MAG: hypothetical protein IKR43_05040 [Lachnospiraceae bacterium]|nr:hypothetical protein [Lachnospiraceae bacterium]